MKMLDFYKKYPTPKDCLKQLEKLRWSDLPRCPYCVSDNCTELPKESRHHCNNCNTTFSVTVGTIFHHTRVDLQKWFMAIMLVFRSKQGISIRQLAEELGVNKNTAWHMKQRISNAGSADSRLMKRILEEERAVSAETPGNRI